MAIGLREAQQMIPLPEANYPEPTESDQRVIPYSDWAKKVMPGPADPLAGPTSPDDLSGLVTSMDRMCALLEKNLIAVRAAHPNMSIPVIGEVVTQPANSGQKITFEIGGKKVPALNVFIQNNTSTIALVTIDDPPSATQGIQVPANGGIINIPDVAVHFLGVWVTVQTAIQGLANLSPGAGTASLLIMAWGNGEYDKIWGMAS